MTESKRDKVLRTAWRLFESQGYHATGINQIIKESGVPKGSFYHYFPNGKEGLAVEAIAAITDGIQKRIRELCEPQADQIVAIGEMFRDIARHLEKSEYQHGGPLTIVASETATTNVQINEACRRAYNTWNAEMFQQLVAAGFPESDAQELATMISASLEGGIILSRTFQSTEPMEHLAQQIEFAITARKQLFQESSQ
jgi:TetR/AcrR family transcriptional regulator, lmrAB and yxaGH operons repressor